jgi:hypothetical protein
MVAPSIHSGTGLDSVTTAPFTAVTVPLPRAASVVGRAAGRSRLSSTSSSKSFAPDASTWRR